MGTVAGFLVLASAFGGLDVTTFHLFRLRLATRPSSRWETVAHLVQSATFLPICLCAAVAPERRAAIGVLFAFHFAAVVVDVLLERDSRASLGGLSRGEYLLHVGGAASTGGALAAFLVGAPVAGSAWQRIGLLAAVVFGVAVSLVELSLFVGVGRGRRRPVAAGAAGWERAPRTERGQRLTQGAQS